MTFYVHPYPYRRMARRAVENRTHTLGINIQVLDDVVRIEGEYKTAEQGYLVRELPTGSFTRTLRLPTVIDADHVEAKIADGVLTLTLPKAESARPKKISIKSR